MKARLIATLTALLLTAAYGASAQADEPTLAWQQSAYVEEMVIVTAPRPDWLEARVEVVYADPAALGDSELAWQQPGYVGEIVIATASRSEVLADLRQTMIEAARLRSELMTGETSALGMPAK